MPHILRADQVIGQWEVPTGGTLRNTPIYKIPPEALWSSRNVLIRAGFLQPRPGLTQFTTSTLASRVTGFFNSEMLGQGAFQTNTFQADTFQEAAGLPESLLVVGTTTKLYIYVSGVFRDVSGATLTAGTSDMARFATIAFGTPQTIYVVHSNGVDAPEQWDATSGVFSAVAGTPPKFRDLTTISEHIIGFVNPFDIRWGNTQLLNTWPAANVRVLSEGGDRIQAIGALGVQAGVVYKTRSLWNVIVTGSGTESEYFRFEHRGNVEGPASPAAVINIDEVAHLYMTPQGRIGYYNGARHMWVGDGIWPLIAADIDQTQMNLAFGAFDPAYRVGVFCYPRTGDTAGTLMGWAIVMLPNPKEGYEDWITFHGASAISLTAGGSLRFGTQSALLAGGTSNKVYTWGGFSPAANDDGSAIVGHWQTGLVGAPGLEFFTLEAYETFALRGAGYGSLTVKPVSSYVLNTEGGTVGDAKTVDLTESKVLGSTKSADIRGRFFGLRYEFTTPITLKWLGGRLSAILRKG